MDQSALLRALGALTAALLAVIGWVAVEVYRAVDVNNKDIAAMRDRISRLEGSLNEIKEIQRDFRRSVIGNMVKPPGIQHPGVDRAE